MVRLKARIGGPIFLDRAAPIAIVGEGRLDTALPAPKRGCGLDPGGGAAERRAVDRREARWHRAFADHAMRAILVDKRRAAARFLARRAASSRTLRRRPPTRRRVVATRRCSRQGRRRRVQWSIAMRFIDQGHRRAGQESGCGPAERRRGARSTRLARGECAERSRRGSAARRCPGSHRVPARELHRPPHPRKRPSDLDPERFGCR